MDEGGDEEAEARLYRSAHKLWLIVISHLYVGLRRVIVGGRRVIVALRFLSGSLCFILLSLECYSAVDLRFAIELQEGEGKQARNDANEHPADEKRTLIRYGIEVHAFNQRTIPEILDMIRMLGALVGATDRADHLVDQI